MLTHPQFDKYFKLSEFDSPDLPNSASNMDASFLYQLTEARLLSKVPFKINSGFRTKARNAKAGGTKDSSHTTGHAADIRAVTSSERSEILNALLSAGFTRIGIGNTFIHVDNDPLKPQNVIWHYYDK